MTMNLPRHVYVCDFCAPAKEDPQRLVVRGEMLLDATSPPYGRRASVLALRMENLLMVKGNTEPIDGSGYDLAKPVRAPFNEVA